MSYAQLVAMLRHAHQHHDMHHLAALNEIRGLAGDPMSACEFRVRVRDILRAVSEVDEDIAAAIEAATR